MALLKDNFGMSKEQLMEKWRDVLEAEVNGEKLSESKKLVTAMMLENTENFSLLKEETGSVDVMGDYRPVLIPMIRRMTPSLISLEIFGTQPITASKGLIACLRSYYQNTTAIGAKRSNSLILKTSKSLTDSTFNSTCTFTVLYKEDDTVGGGVNNFALVSLTDTDCWSSGDTVLTTGMHPANDGTCDILSIYENEALYHIIFKNYTKYATASGEALTTNMPELGFEVETMMVDTVSRILKAKWTVELEQDLKNVWNMDAETLLKELATSEITAEMNREAIDKVHTFAIRGGEKTWNYSTADGRWEIERYQNLVALISRTSREIAFSSRMGQGNFIIVSPNVYSALETAKVLSNNSPQDNFMVNPYGGTMLGYIRVFVDMYAPEDYVLMGYKDTSNELKAGIFYTPYIPLQITQIRGAEDGQPRMVFRTRYGYHEHPFGASNYFRKIKVTNLPLASAGF